MFPRLREAAFLITASIHLSSCVTGSRLRPVPGNEAVAVPRYIELAGEQSIATIHFPPGLYALALEDRRGYYYRSTRPVIQHSFAGFDKVQGGIFLAKTRRTVRAYVMRAGGRTLIGHLRPAQYSFRE